MLVRGAHGAFSDLTTKSTVKASKCPSKCILLWTLYVNAVDFSFIVSLYVSDLLNVTISTRRYCTQCNKK